MFQHPNIVNSFLIKYYLILIPFHVFQILIYQLIIMWIELISSLYHIQIKPSIESIIIYSKIRFNQIPYNLNILSALFGSYFQVILLILYLQNILIATILTIICFDSIVYGIHPIMPLIVPFISSIYLLPIVFQMISV